MKYSLACGFAALALGGCVNNNPFYVDPTGASSSTSEDPTMTASDSSTSVATTEGSTGDPDTDDPNTSVGTSVSTSTSTTSEGSSGAVTMDTGDDTGNTTMPAAFCGDGEVNPGEVCDDGNEDEDECTVACLPPPSLEGLLPAGISELLGYEGKSQDPGLCPGILTGVSIFGDPEIGLLRVKFLCKDFEFVPIGEGAFEVDPVGPISYGEYIGSDAISDENWVPECPPGAPALVGFGGWANDTHLTRLELQCVKLVLLPKNDGYKLIYENLQEPPGGYNDWGQEQAHVGCNEYPGTFAADVVVHTSELGVSGLEVLCSEPDLGI